jgi:hypothetical protein
MRRRLRLDEEDGRTTGDDKVSFAFWAAASAAAYVAAGACLLAPALALSAALWLYLAR